MWMPVERNVGLEPSAWGGFSVGSVAAKGSRCVAALDGAQATLTRSTDSIERAPVCRQGERGVSACGVAHLQQRRLQGETTHEQTERVRLKAPCCVSTRPRPEQHQPH